MKVIIINGPNLNLLGKREESMYGNISFEKHFIELKNNFTRLELEYYQSNIEGEIINKLHEIGFSYDCILLNAGGYTHTSVAITDAIASISTDVIEVHMTNIYSREEFRKKSLLSVNCKSVICGFGLESYNLALESLKL
jgi:3-dehydroquinate dehydratase-2|tara:strand:+ start:71 stop:487 length:417 start_codon:yes stop_codon:yes gene_type:complete